MIPPASNPRMTPGQRNPVAICFARNFIAPRKKWSAMSTTWIVADYRPTEGKVSYARLAQGSNIGLVDVTCTEEGGGTVVTVRYTLTGVSEQGRAFVREFLEAEHYTRMIEEWRVATSAALSRCERFA